ncbi:nucleolar protein 58 [Bacillus rossius redtenbacheri]|uniref:nucleolar protein 58 n=1 Tax=Bacillus rossius redtenbacheri TaxID=93214 RepID=UPI002FDC9425
MLVLFETPAGYAIFKLLDEKKLAQTENLYKDFETPEAASKIVKLKHFEKFLDTTEALAATTATVEGKLGKGLKKLLKKLVGKELQEQLLVADAKLGNAIKDKLNLSCMSNTSVQELMRCIRSQMDGLLAGFPKKEMAAMALGLAHSLSRYKLKFSPDKVDTMIVQAVCLLDDLDKELNKYVMRCREWYGWHFPELGRLVTDQIAYAKTIKIIGTRDCTASADLSDILPQEIEDQVKEAAEISMGTEISEEDVLNIQSLCDEIIEMTGYRTQLYDYLQARMMAIAPNLTVLVGDLVGARLISHSGSLINLAKQPASTIQILGAEKALFRALKARKDTPKYGLIYHAGLVGQTSTLNKGKISRMLAAKTALASRVDALGEESASIDLGAEHKVKIERRIKFLEEGKSYRISGTGKAKARFEKYHGKSEVKQYQAAADFTVPAVKRKHSDVFDDDKKVLIEELPSSEAGPSETPKKKTKKPKLETGTEDVEIKEEDDGVIKKKKKKRDLEESVDVSVTDETTPGEGKKKKKRKHLSEGFDSSVDVSSVVKTEDDQERGEEKKKKKKKHKIAEDSFSGDQSFGLSAMLGSPEEPGSSKKKKKQRKQSEGEQISQSVKLEAGEEDDETPPPEMLSGTPQEGKKKKKKQLILGLEGAESLYTETGEEAEQMSEKKKKKKKKKSLSLDE